METVFGINMVALQDGQPKLMSLKEMLEAFIRHRREVVTRRTIYDLAKAREQGPHPRGSGVALANIDAVIALIKPRLPPRPHALQARACRRAWSPHCSSAPAPFPPDPRVGRRAGPGCRGLSASETQAQAILDMRLHRLTGS